MLLDAVESIIPRKAFIYWYELFNKEKAVLPADVAFVIKQCGERKFITWEKVLNDRRDKQARQLSLKRNTYGRIEWRRCIVWVFFNDTWCFHGWYCYLEGFKWDYGINWNRSHDGREDLENKLMQLFPVINLLFPDFYEWMKEFCKAHPWKKFGCKLHQGKALAWVKFEGSKITEIELEKPKTTK